jgi:hypothetical protein
MGGTAKARLKKFNPPVLELSMNFSSTDPSQLLQTDKHTLDGFSQSY